MVPRQTEQLSLDALPWDDMMLEDKLQQDGRMHLGFSLDLAFFCRIANKCEELEILDVVARQLEVQSGGLQKLMVVSAGETMPLTSSHMADTSCLKAARLAASFAEPIRLCRAIQRAGFAQWIQRAARA